MTGRATGSPPSGRAARAAGIAVLLLTAAACSGGQARPADLGGSPSAAAPSSSAGTTPPSFVPPIPSGSVPPTVGVPTDATAELRRSGGLSGPVRRTWIAYQEALSESLRAHRPTSELRRLAGPTIIQMVEKRAPRDEADGLTVSLRPLGRLESTSGSDEVVRVRACLWAPSVGFFVEADGREAEGGEPGWVEYATTLERDGDVWTVTEDGRTGRTCAGGAP